MRGFLSKWLSFIRWASQDSECRKMAFNVIVGHFSMAGLFILNALVRIFFGFPGDLQLAVFFLIYLVGGGYFTYLFCITIHRIAERNHKWPS